MMFSKEQIGEYMVFGFIKPFSYKTPVGKNYDISFEDAKIELLKRFKENVLEINETYPNALYTLSGGLDTSMIISLIKDSRPTTICMEAKPISSSISRILSKKWNTNHIALNLDIDLKKSLIEINETTPVPYQPFPGNVFMWKLMNRGKEESNELVVGTGSGSLLHEYFRFPEQEEMLYYSIKRNDYDIKLAQKILETSKYPDPQCYFKPSELIRRKIKDETYIEYFTNIYDSSYFDKRDLNEYSICMPDYSLRQDNLEHFLQWSQDWLMQGHELDRYKYWGKNLGINVISPFFMNGFDDFLLSLPYEYCDCLGFSRHVYREAIGDLLPYKIMTSIREGLNGTVDWYNNNILEFKKLYEEYIFPNDKLIHQYIEYNKLQILFKDNFNKINDSNFKTFFKCFILINLSMWLEINHG